MSTRTILVTLGICAALTAQDVERPAADDLVARSCATMSQLKGVTFSTIAEQNSAMTRRFRAMMPATETEVAGTWSGGLLHASLNFDDDEVVVHGDRMIARAGSGEWKRRHGVTVTGQPTPFLFHPARFFELLDALPADVREETKREPVTWRKHELVLISLTLENDAARDVVLGGAVPPVSGGAGMIMIGGPGGGFGGGEAPDITVDLALYVDPASGLVHRIRSKAYQKSNLPGNVQIEVAGADFGADEEEADPVEEFDSSGNRIYKHGLPVRELDEQTSLGDFEVRFSDHDESAAPTLDERARKLLGLRRGV